MKLSIITINYNNHDGLRKTIESIVNQTCKEFQYIVIDGGSTDGSVDVIKTFANQIDYWVSEPDRGIYHAMNKGIDKAEGEYCLFINSGDCLYNENVIGKCISHLDGGVQIVSGGTYIGGHLRNAFQDISLELFYRKGSISHPATFIRTELLEKYHYDESYRIVSDWKFWIQVLIKDDVTYKAIDEVVSIFDLSGISSTNIELCRKENAVVLKELFSDRILVDYRNQYDGWENCLYNGIKTSKYRKHIYTLNVLVLKLMSIFKKDSWVSKFPLRLKD